MNIKKHYVIGELDTFKKAACLAIAIKENPIIKSNNLKTTSFLNCAIAVDTALLMCETPIWNVGPYHDRAKEMEKVNFKEVFKSDSSLLEEFRDRMIESLLYEKNGSSLLLSLSLLLFYEIALSKKQVSKLTLK